MANYGCPEIFNTDQGSQFTDVYLKAYSSVTEATRRLAEYFKFYNDKRWHQNFDKKTPSMVYFGSLAHEHQLRAVLHL
ncbi:MAG: hypothetical protein WC373_07225 [Smithella sp.]